MNTTERKDISAFGFFRAAAAIPVSETACCSANARHIIELARTAARRKVSLAVFPELSVTGYTCADLFHQELLLANAGKAVGEIAEATSGLQITLAVGAPVRYSGKLYNCAVVISGGKISGIVPKSYIPDYGEFYEARWFASGLGIREKTCSYAGQEGIPFGTDLLFASGDVVFGVEICEDLWAPVPPSSCMSVAGACIIANLSASNELAGKHEYRTGLVSQQSGRCIGGYIYSSAGFGESTTDTVFSGDSMIAENGKILASGTRFLAEASLITADIDCSLLSTLRMRMNTFTCSGLPQYRTVQVCPPAPETSLMRDIYAWPFIPQGDRQDTRLQEIIDIQTIGLLTRLSRSRAASSVIGVSGGLDSTLAILVTALAYRRSGLDMKGIIGITMPGLATSGRTRSNAVRLMELLGTTTREIPIGAAVRQHFADIGISDEDRGTAYENTQARERTQILMDIANLTGGIVIGTGDLSESALGWCTFNGDHMSMYNVNCSIPKTLVRHLVVWIAANKADFLAPGNKALFREILEDIADTPISPELIPAEDSVSIAQKTEDIIGPYELHDFFLYHMIRLGESPDKILFLAEKAFAGRYGTDTISKWLKTFLRRFMTQQFKRSSSPDGPKVGTVSLSPRGDWRMPSDTVWDDWM